MKRIDFRVSDRNLCNKLNLLNISREVFVEEDVKKINVIINKLNKNGAQASYVNKNGGILISIKNPINISAVLR